MDKEGSRLLNFIRKRIPNPDEAEDLLQDVLDKIETIKKLKNYDDAKITI